MSITRFNVSDDGIDYIDNGDYCVYEEIEAYIKLAKVITEYGFPDGTDAGDDIGELLQEIKEQNT